MTDRGLSTLQRVFFWSGFVLPIPSICLYVIVPSGTVEFFGGTSTPSADFWCSIAASGDAVVSVLCYSVLTYPNNVLLRTIVLRANAIYSLFHFGGFLRAHYTLEPHPGGPWGYIISIIISWVAYLCWGCNNTGEVDGSKTFSQDQLLSSSWEGKQVSTGDSYSGSLS